MDSDDNCLVIDEDVEIDPDERTVSVEPIIVDAENDENDNSQEVNIVVGQHGIFETPTSSPIHPLFVREESSPKPKTREERTPKSKHRNSEKSKNRDNRGKSTPTSSSSIEKRRNKAHYIRLTDDVFKEKKLNIAAKKHQLYNMNFSYKDGILSASIPEVYPRTPIFPDLNLSQLLNWPDIKMTVFLEHLTFAREVEQNCQRDLVFGNDKLVNVSTQSNPTETRYLQKVQTSKVKSMVLKEIFEEYVTAIMEAAPSYEIGPSKLPEIEHSFQKILDDVKTIPSDSIQTRVTHSRFLNQHKYFRVIDNDPKSVNGDLKVRLRETINPEVIFSIDKCTFTTDQPDVWVDALNEYFADIFGKRETQNKISLKDRFKKCLAAKCSRCNETFEGPLWTVKLKDHISRHHFVDKPWRCVKCKGKWDQFELLQMEWKHECSEPRNA